MNAPHITDGPAYEKKRNKKVSDECAPLVQKPGKKKNKIKCFPEKKR
jgi:hypothetical protein